MKNLNEIDLKIEVLDIIKDFGGHSDTQVLGNIMINNGNQRVQLSISLIDEFEPDFIKSDYTPVLYI